jgi:hypothetical protein
MQMGRRVGQHRSTKQFGGGVAFYVIRIKSLDEQAFFERKWDDFRKNQRVIPSGPKIKTPPLFLKSEKLI